MVPSRAVRARRFQPRRVAAVGVAAAALLTLSLSACGSGSKQDADEPSGDFRVETSAVSFPRLQGLGETESLRMRVRNTGQQTVPNLVVTVDGFGYRTTQPGVADPQRPLWVVNIGPRVYQTAYVNTWATGPLAPGRSRTLSWSVTSVVPGTHTLRWRVQAGLDGNARAVTGGDQPVAGDVTVRVTRRPQDTVVDPATGQVVPEGSSAASN